MTSRGQTSYVFPTKPVLACMVFISLAVMPCVALGQVASSVVSCSPDIAATPTDSKEERGVKSWMVKKAVRLLAKAIRHGGEAIHHVVKFLDDEAARVFRKHSRNIADGLDDIAKIPDLSVKIVREKIIYFMVNDLGISYGTAEVIGEAIEGALWIVM